MSTPCSIRRGCIEGCYCTDPGKVLRGSACVAKDTCQGWYFPSVAISHVLNEPRTGATYHRKGARDRLKGHQKQGG